MLGKQTFYYDEMKTPIETLSLLSNGKQILRIDYGSFENLQAGWLPWIKRYYGEVSLVKEPEPLEKAKKEMAAYFSGNLTSFTFDYDLPGTSFQKQVWQALVEKIPYGGTKTYKGVAEIISNPKAVRAVGGAVNKNPLTIVVPCHRVVGANGKLVGYNGGLDKKEFLLNHELQLK